MGEYVHVLLQRVLVEGVGQVFHVVLATQKGLQLPQLDRRIEPPTSFESLAACWVCTYLPCRFHGMCNSPATVKLN